ncbi:unnamed protein product [Rotaria socialis]|uniref:Uncharacterized protein n=2 Tax=Rotaria socialis TaxID=392032 RepID=A0A818BIJ9_9BILA|nr:unnamed protein product [Rotaria socialis]
MTDTSADLLGFNDRTMSNPILKRESFDTDDSNAVTVNSGKKTTPLVKSLLALILIVVVATAVTVTAVLLTRSPTKFTTIFMAVKSSTLPSMTDIASMTTNAATPGTEAITNAATPGTEAIPDVTSTDVTATKNIAVTVTITSAGAAATTTKRIATNLLLNPGAEEGSIVGWKQTTALPVIVDSNGAFNAGYNPHSGLYCFAGGNGLNSGSSGLIQNVKLLGGVQGFTESQLDSQIFRAELRFYYQTWDRFFMRHYQVKVSVTFRSSSSAIVNKVSTGELACKTSNP